MPSHRTARSSRLLRQVRSGDRMAGIEQALAEERAYSLGRAGDRLEEAIDDHRLLVEVGRADDDQVDAALRAVSRAAWALMVQRECAGFRDAGLEWLRAHYDIPPAALRRI